MRTYEKIAAAILAVTVPAELIVAAGIAGTASAWTWWVLLGCAFLQLSAMAVVKVGWERATGKKAKLFGERKALTYRERLRREHPSSCNERFIGGCRGCPGDHYPGAPKETLECAVGGPAEMERRCAACWDQEAKV